MGRSPVSGVRLEHAFAPVFGAYIAAYTGHSNSNSGSQPSPISFCAQSTNVSKTALLLDFTLLFYV